MRGVLFDGSLISISLLVLLLPATVLAQEPPNIYAQEPNYNPIIPKNSTYLFKVQAFDNDYETGDPNSHFKITFKWYLDGKLVGTNSRYLYEKRNGNIIGIESTYVYNAPTYGINSELKVEASDGAMQSVHKWQIIVPDNCTTPEDFMFLRESTLFCPGSYEITESLIVDSDNISINCNGAVFDGKNGSHTAFSINNINNTSVENCKIHNFGTGISIHDSNRIAIKSNDLANNYRGLRINDSNNFNVQKNSLNHNEYGILTTNAFDAIIENNYFSKNGSSIYLSDSNYLTVKANKIFDTHSGIQLFNSKLTGLYENSIEDARYGISLSYSSYNLLGGNVSNDNTFAGISLLDSNFNDLVYNHTSANERGGIELWFSNNNTVAFSNSSRNVTSISLYKSANNNIYANEFTLSENGINLSESAQNSIRYNQVNFNNIGLNATKSTDNNITDNNMFRNKLYGTILENESINNTVLRNKFTLKGNLYDRELDNIFCIDNIGNSYREGASGPTCPDWYLVIYPIDPQLAVVGRQFTLPTDYAAFNPSSVVFSDDSPLFDINSETGKVLFTPSSDQIGKHSVTITITDNVSESSASFELNIVDESTDKCTDPDGGLNYYSKSTADDRQSGIGSWWEDVCLLRVPCEPGDPGFGHPKSCLKYTRVNECTGPLCNLQEGYCTEGKSSNIAYTCPNGCRNGACITRDLQIQSNENSLMNSKRPATLRTIQASATPAPSQAPLPSPSPASPSPEPAKIPAPSISPSPQPLASSNPDPQPLYSPKPSTEPSQSPFPQTD